MKIAKVVVLAGQSNAVGVGHTAYLSQHFPPEKVEEYNKGYENVSVFYYSHDQKSEGFVPVRTNCAQQDKETFGPEVGIAEYFTARHPEEKLFILKCAVGGTNLRYDWCSPSRKEGGYDPKAGTQFKDGIWQSIKPKGAGWLYNQFVQTVSEGLALLESQGLTPQIQGFCWMQGESDANPECCERYIGWYDAFLQDVLQNFGAYMQDCIFVDAGISERWECHTQINAAKADYAAKRQGYKFIDTVAAGLTVHNEPPEKPDTAHYDSDSVIQLGHLFAEGVEL